MFIFVFGIVTFGLGWSLFLLLSPGDRDLGDLYYGLTFGSPASATIGMRVMDLEMRTWYGAPAYFVLGAVHAIVFWIRCRCSRRSSCWSACSTSGGGCCTTSWSARSSSTIRCAPRSCGRRARGRSEP